MGRKSSINGSFSMAMLNNQMIYHQFRLRMEPLSILFPRCSRLEHLLQLSIVLITVTVMHVKRVYTYIYTQSHIEYHRDTVSLNTIQLQDVTSIINQTCWSYNEYGSPRLHIFQFIFRSQVPCNQEWLAAEIPYKQRYLWNKDMS